MDRTVALFFFLVFVVAFGFFMGIGVTRHVDSSTRVDQACSIDVRCCSTPHDLRVGAKLPPFCRALGGK